MPSILDDAIKQSSAAGSQFGKGTPMGAFWHFCLKQRGGTRYVRLCVSGSGYRRGRRPGLVLHAPLYPVIKSKGNSDRCLSMNISAAAAVIPLRCCAA